MYRRFALSILTAIPLALSAGHAGAAEIYVVGAGAIEEPFEALAAEFSKANGHKVHAIFGPVGGMQAKLKGGEKADVIVLSTAAMDELDKAGVPGRRQPRRARPRGRRRGGASRRAGARHLDPRCLQEGAAGGAHGRLHQSGRRRHRRHLHGRPAGALRHHRGDEEEGPAAEQRQRGRGRGRQRRRRDRHHRSPASCCPTRASRWSEPCRNRSGSRSAYVAAVSSASKEAEPARALIAYMTRPASRDHFKEAGL